MTVPGDENALEIEPRWSGPETSVKEWGLKFGLAWALIILSLPSGTAMTPNFVSNVNTSVALSCTCRGSGNLQEECEQLEESFSHNPCLSECVPPAPSPRGPVSWAKGEERGQLCGPHWVHPSSAGIS